MIFTLPFLISFALLPWAQANPFQYLDTRFDYNNLKKDDVSAFGEYKSNYTTYYFDQPLDHKDPKSITFKNRYWVETKYYKPGGPVIITNGGEANAYPADGYFQNTVFKLMAQKMNGIIVLFEHRYYGESHLPAGQNPQWKYLTVDQSLEDMANFIKHGKKIAGIPYDVSVPKTKWIIRGGSYSGNLAAWMRYKYPNLVSAAVSSSGPVQPQIDFYQYFNPIIQYGPSKCINALHNIVVAVDSFVANHPAPSTENTKYKAMFGMDASTSDADFTNAVSGLATGLWQSAYPGHYPFQEKVCSLFAKTNDPKKQFDIYAKWIKAQLSRNQNVNKRQVDPYENSWYWQICTEFGYWQNVPPKNTPWFKRRITSNLTTTEYYKQGCKQLFNFHGDADVKSILNKYKGWDLHYNKIVWINGEWDPWKPLSVESDDAPKRRNTTFEKSLVIPNGVHCFDYDTDASLNNLHTYTINTLKSWLNIKK
ncbi:unnamed protein product [Cunninghamella echinulata]